MGVSHLKNWETIPLKIYELRQQNKSSLWRNRVMTWHLQMYGCSILWGPQIAFLSLTRFSVQRAWIRGSQLIWSDIRPQWTPRLTSCPGLGICFRSSVSLWWFKYDFSVTFIHGLLSCGRRLRWCHSYWYSRKAVTHYRRIYSKAEQPRVLSLPKNRRSNKWKYSAEVIRGNTPQK